jgi:hypothetical protein
MLPNFAAVLVTTTTTDMKKILRAAATLEERSTMVMLDPNAAVDCVLVLGFLFFAA